MSKLYTNEYKLWQLSHIVNNLKIGGGRTLVDIGCGSGEISNLVKDKLDLSELELVDPYSGVGVQLNAIDFFRTNRKSYDYILFKESLHHTPDRDLDELFSACSKYTNKCLLIVTRPKYNIDYPFNGSMRKKWENSQTSPYNYLDLIHKYGFKNCELITHRYNVSMSVENWIQCVESRMWSIFGPDEREYIEWLRRNFKWITFEERLVIVKGVK